MRFTLGSVTVHFQQCCGPLSFGKKLKKRQQKLVREIYVWQKEMIHCTWLSVAVRFSVWSNAFICLKQYIRWFWSREKQSVRFSVKSKLLLNRKVLERVFYMKKLRLVDIFPTAYHLNHLDKAVCKNFAKNGRCLSKSATRFSKLNKNRKESQNHFNISKLRLVRSFPMAYHMSRFDKRLENWSENSTENLNFFLKNRIPRFSKFETALKP